MADNQPTLPDEVRFTDIELNFMDESPPGLFPENQDSNFGFVIRKLFTDRVQQLVDQQNTMYSERFIDTTSAFMDMWEKELGLPINPAKTVDRRRGLLKIHAQKGPFTRERRDEIIEYFITELTPAGEPLRLTEDGLVLDAGGLALFNEDPGVAATWDTGVILDSGGVDLSAGGVLLGNALWYVSEWTSQFRYEIFISNALTVDTVGLTRELEWLTPAPVTFSITRFTPMSTTGFTLGDQTLGTGTLGGGG
jgi:hypothetical protein